MFGAILLDWRLSMVAVLLAALVEWAVVRFIDRRRPWVLTAGERKNFSRRRVSLALAYLAGIAVYHYLSKIYPYDPFFFALFTFLVAFAIFYYAAGLAVSLASGWAFGPGEQDAGPALHTAVALAMLAAFGMRPQVSILGFFTGAAARALGRMPRSGRGAHRWWLALGMAAYLAVLILVLSR